MPSVDMTEAEFRELFEAVSNWGRWDATAERGALNNLTPERVAAAARLVRSGVTVTLSLPLNTEARIDIPEPADHHMTMLTDVDIGSGSVRFAKDYVGVDYHNDGPQSHRRLLATSPTTASSTTGHRSESVTAEGAGAGSIDILKDGLVGRGVLLDVPRLRGVPWLEPGEHVFREDLEAAEREQGVRVGPGDILLVRTGHARRRAELPPWDTRAAKAGLHPTTASFLAERGVAALGSDGNNDTAPAPPRGSISRSTCWRSTRWGSTCSTTSSSRIWSQQCEAAQRWEFLFAAAPLRIVRGTGSPLNPTAIF